MECESHQKAIPRCLCCYCSLNGLAGNVCPRCGRGFDLSDPDTYESALPFTEQNKFHMRVGLLLALVFLLLACLPEQYLTWLMDDMFFAFDWLFALVAIVFFYGWIPCGIAFLIVACGFFFKNGRLHMSLIFLAYVIGTILGTLALVLDNSVRDRVVLIIPAIISMVFVECGLRRRDPMDSGLYIMAMIVVALHLLLAQVFTNIGFMAS